MTFPLRFFVIFEGSNDEEMDCKRTTGLTHNILLNQFSLQEEFANREDGKDDT